MKREQTLIGARNFEFKDSVELEMKSENTLIFKKISLNGGMVVKCEHEPNNFYENILGEMEFNAKWKLNIIDRHFKGEMDLSGMSPFMMIDKITMKTMISSMLINDGIEEEIMQKSMECIRMIRNDFIKSIFFKNSRYNPSDPKIIKSQVINAKYNLSIFQIEQVHDIFCVNLSREIEKKVFPSTLNNSRNIVEKLEECLKLVNLFFFNIRICLAIILENIEHVKTLYSKSEFKVLEELIQEMNQRSSSSKIYFDMFNEKILHIITRSCNELKKIYTKRMRFITPINKKDIFSLDDKTFEEKSDWSKLLTFSAENMLYNIGLDATEILNKITIQKINNIMVDDILLPKKPKEDNPNNTYKDIFDRMNANKYVEERVNLNIIENHTPFKKKRENIMEFRWRRRFENDDAIEVEYGNKLKLDKENLGKMNLKDIRSKLSPLILEFIKNKIAEEMSEIFSRNILFKQITYIRLSDYKRDLMKLFACYIGDEIDALKCVTITLEELKTKVSVVRCLIEIAKKICTGEGRLEKIVREMIQCLESPTELFGSLKGDKIDYDKINMDSIAKIYDCMQNGYNLIGSIEVLKHSINLYSSSLERGVLNLREFVSFEEKLKYIEEILFIYKNISSLIPSLKNNPEYQRLAKEMKMILVGNDRDDILLLSTYFRRQKSILDHIQSMVLIQDFNWDDQKNKFSSYIKEWEELSYTYSPINVFREGSRTSLRHYKNILNNNKKTQDILNVNLEEKIKIYQDNQSHPSEKTIEILKIFVDISKKELDTEKELVLIPYNTLDSIVLIESEQNNKNSSIFTGEITTFYFMEEICKIMGFEELDCLNDFFQFSINTIDQTANLKIIEPIEYEKNKKKTHKTSSILGKLPNCEIVECNYELILVHEKIVESTSTGVSTEKKAVRLIPYNNSNIDSNACRIESIRRCGEQYIITNKKKNIPFSHTLPKRSSSEKAYDRFFLQTTQEQKEMDKKIRHMLNVSMMKKKNEGFLVKVKIDNKIYNFESLHAIQCKSKNEKNDQKYLLLSNEKGYVNFESNLIEFDSRDLENSQRIEKYIAYKGRLTSSEKREIIPIISSSSSSSSTDSNISYLPTNDENTVEARIVLKIVLKKNKNGNLLNLVIENQFIIVEDR